MSWERVEAQAEEARQAVREAEDLVERLRAAEAYAVGRDKEQLQQRRQHVEQRLAEWREDLEEAEKIVLRGSVEELLREL